MVERKDCCEIGQTKAVALKVLMLNLILVTRGP